MIDRMFEQKTILSNMETSQDDSTMLHSNDSTMKKVLEALSKQVLRR